MKTIIATAVPDSSQKALSYRTFVRWSQRRWMSDKRKPRSAQIFAIAVNTTIMLMNPKSSGTRNRARMILERMLDPLATITPTAFQATPRRIRRASTAMERSATGSSTDARGLKTRSRA